MRLISQLQLPSVFVPLPLPDVAALVGTEVEVVRFGVAPEASVVAPEVFFAPQSSFAVPADALQVLPAAAVVAAAVVIGAGRSAALPLAAGTGSADGYCCVVAGESTGIAVGFAAGTSRSVDAADMAFDFVEGTLTVLRKYCLM